MSQDGPNDPFFTAGKPAAGKIPNDEFYRTFGPPTPGNVNAPVEPVFRDVTEPGHIDSAEFFRKEAHPEPRSTWLRSPFKLGGSFAGIGAAGVLLGSVTFIHDVVLVAPIFEELFKFGLALLLVALLRAEHPMLRLLVALLPGVSFGVMEHSLTYSGEPLSTYAFRVVFHSGSTALSMTMYSIVEPLSDPRTRLFATIPSTILHWLNNATAVLSAVLGLFGLNVASYQFAIGLLVGLGAHALAWGLLLVQRNLRLFAARQVRSLDPLVPPEAPAAPPTTPPLFVVGDMPASPPPELRASAVAVARPTTPPPGPSRGAVVRKVAKPAASEVATGVGRARGLAKASKPEPKRSRAAPRKKAEPPGEP